MTDQTPTPKDDAPDFSWSGEASPLSSGRDNAWEGLAAARPTTLTDLHAPAGQTHGADAPPSVAPGVAKPSEAVAPAWETLGALLSGGWGLAAGLALAAAAVLLLAGGPSHASWGALGALGLGAAVVGGFWASRSGLSQAAAHPEAGAAPQAAAPMWTRPIEPSPRSDDGKQSAVGAVSASSETSETARLEGLLGALPELGLLMDAQGRADTVFGKPLAGVCVDDLHGGLPDLAAEADRPALLDALRRAAAGVPGRAAFALASAPQRRLTLSLSKTPAGDIAGILQEAPALAAEAAPPPPAEEKATPVSPSEDAVQAAHTALTSAEAERDAARAESASKSRFLANMSHELRTPLNAIIGFSDIMKTKLFGPLPARYAEYAELIHESGRHLTDLINDILDMSKLEADRYELQREVFDAREPVSSALKLMRLQADDVGVHLRGDLPSEALTVDADRRALKQIVLNLVSNALKFTPPEGRVDVTLRAQGGALELVVADTGVGIAAEDLKRLGTPYEQTDAGRRAQGTGLGLSLVKALTALHGGEFSLESRLGEGSAATVRLPVLVKPAAAEPAQPAS